ncbi:MAG TPA: nuclear transport factor 2 family protein [Gammaproteobacteria bacterium]|nr:nuclear transport factor 2 family protein [Gammaproteobacteria bacterium]
MRIARILLAISMAAASSGALAAKKPAIPDPAWFQKNTQALYDALAPGTKSVWQKALADDAVISDEDGRVQTKAELLKDFGPLPPGSNGSIKVIDLKVLPIGTVGAVVDYIIDEHEDVQGQSLHTQYTVTDVYRSQLTGWKIVASHVTVVPRDMDPVPVDKTGWPALVGEYRVGPQSKHSYHVYLREGALLGGADEQTATALIPLAPLVYFQSGSIHTMIFVPDGKGGIAEVREVHKYNELVMKRVGP